MTTSPRKSACIIIGIVTLILLVMLVPFYFLTKSFGWWQKEFVARGYAVGVQIHQNVYELNLFDLAFTKPVFDHQSVYVPANSLGSYFTLVALSQQSFPTRKNILLPTENPYFNGRISITALNIDTAALASESRQYLNAGESYRITRLTASPDRSLFSFSTDDNAPEILQSSPYLKDIVNQGMCRTDGQSNGCGIAEDTYINLSDVLHNYFRSCLIYWVDDENKRIILQFIPMPGPVLI